MGKAIDKITSGLLKWILPIVAFTIPLFFLPVTSDFFGLNKRYLLAVIASVSLICFLVRNIVHRQIKLRLTPSTASLFLLSLIFVISSIVQSPTPYVSLLGKTSLVVALTVIFISVTSSVKNHSLVNITFAALILSAVLSSLFSLGNLTGLTSSLINIDWLKDKTFSPTGGIIPSLSFSLPLLPAALFLAIKTKRPLAKVLLLGSSAILLITSISQVNYLRSLEPSPIFRLPLLAGWSIALDIFKNWRTALIGSGPETFFSVYTRLKPLSLNLTGLWNIRFSNSSNELLELLTTVGLLGAFFSVAAAVKPLKLAFNQIKLKKDVTPELTASFIFTAGTVVAMLLIPASIVLFTAFFVGLILLNLSLGTDTKAGKDIDINLSGVAPSLLPGAAFLLSLIGLAVFWINAAKAYAANYISFQAGQLLKSNTTQSYDLQIKAFQIDPKNSAYRINFAQTSMALANEIAKQKDLSDDDKKNVTQLIQQAIREAKNATDLDPQNVIAWENLSNIYRQLAGFVQGAPDWTVASYSQAISLDPGNPALRLELGSFFYSLSDFDQAEKIYEQAVNIKPNWANAHYNLATALKAKKEYAKALSEMKIVAQLLDPKSEDVKKVQEEEKELEKLAPTPTPTPTPSPTPTK